MIGGRYELLTKLGSGGMAEVWLAADHRLNGKHVAVKRLHGFRPGGEESSVDLERARREAYAASRLSHPNLVAVTDFIAENGEPFIVMEYVAGTTLDELIGADGMPASEAARILAQVAAALADAHEARIVHRDIKPANIMVTPRGDAKLADFGIARSPDDPRFTQTGSFTGTIRYLAPEILNGEASTPAGDMWALGATLFEAVEGRAAFDAPTVPALIAAIAMQPPPVLRRNPSLAPLIARLLDRDPARRPVAAEVADQLRAVATTDQHHSDLPFAPVIGAPPVGYGDPTVARQNYAGGWAASPAAPPTRPRVRPKRRSPRWVLVAVPVALVVAGAGVVVGIATSGDDPAVDGGVAAPPGLSASASSNSFPGNAQSSDVPAGSAPASTVASTGTGSAGISFRGVTVRGARDLGAEPKVMSAASGEPNGLEVKDLVTGRGDRATPTSNVTLRYVGALYRDGSKFDTSWDNPNTAATFDLAQTVPGFAQGVGGMGSIEGMRAGGRRLMIFPSRLGYGSEATGDIPANAPLVFVVDLVSVQ